MTTPPYFEIKSHVDEERFLCARRLTPRHLLNCLLLPDRVELLKYLPTKGTVAEVGTLRGEFAKDILSIATPAKFHIIDKDFTQFDRAHFSEHIKNNAVVLHEGDSSSILGQFPDRSFDWVYIDADHTFEGVRKDIISSLKIIKESGYLVFNDYTAYSSLEKCQYGVMRAVNDLCLDENFECIFFALNPLGYHDVAVRRMSLR